MSKEPLALPRGSVRALMAIAVTATTLYLMATQQPVPAELLVLNGTVVTFYFATRREETASAPVEDELPEPVLGNGEDA